METAVASKNDPQYNLRIPERLRGKLRRAVRRASFERDRDVSTNTFILEAINEKLEREAA